MYDLAGDWEEATAGQCAMLSVDKVAVKKKRLDLSDVCDDENPRKPLYVPICSVGLPRE